MATAKGPGKAFRTGVSRSELTAMFPTDDAAREWLEAHIWPDGPFCPRCGSFNVQRGIRHKTMTHRCRECAGRPRFSLKSGNVMEGSKLGYQTWAVALGLAMAGVTGMKLRRDLAITQKSAWHLARRIRRMLDGGEAPVFRFPAGAEQTIAGGKRKSFAGRGAAGGDAMDRESKRAATRRMQGAGALMRTTGQY